MPDLPDFTAVYKGRMMPELIYLAQTLAALDSVHAAMDSSIGLTEPKLQAAEKEFRRLLQQNIVFVSREITTQAEALPKVNL